MTAADEGAGKLRISSPHGGGPARFAATALIVVAILLVTVCFAVRTEGGREFVRERLVKYLGLDLTLDAARIGLPYDLVVEGLRSADADAGITGLQCGELRIGFAGWRRYRVAILEATVTLARDPDGRWEPGGLDRLGELVDDSVVGVSRLTAGLRERLTVSVEKGAVDWYDGQALLASADGISFCLRPVELPEKRMYYYRLSVESARGPSGSRCGDVQREWLASESFEYLELAASGSDIPGTGPAFWEVQ